MSLRFRLNGLVLVVLLAIVLAGGGLVIVIARHSVYNEVDSSVNLAVRLIEYEIKNTAASGQGPKDWRDYLSQLERSRHLKIRLLNLSDNRTSVDTQYDRNSVRGVPDWFVWAVAPGTERITKVVPVLDGGDVKLVIQANPADEIIEAWGEARLFFLTVVVFAGLICVLLTLTVARAFKPVSKILTGLDDIEQGIFNHPLPDFSLEEFTRIARAINHTALALDKARKDNKALTEHSLEIQEQERQYLAQELHDEFGQNLSAIKAMVVAMKAENLTDLQRSSVGSIIDICDNMFLVLATLMRRLRPMMLDELGLQASLEDIIEVWSGSDQGLDISLEFDVQAEALTNSKKIQIFRIVQEGLTNTVKHAEASKVDVRIKVTGNNTQTMQSDRSGENKQYLSLHIIDNGVGFDSGTQPFGFGLMGIHERVDGLGGNMILTTSPGRGCKLCIEIPHG